MKSGSRKDRTSVLYAAVRAAAYCALVFCAVVAVLLVISQLRVRSADVLNMSALTELRERLKANPGDAELLQQFRALDLLARQAFFGGVRFMTIGAGLLAGGTVLLCLALRVLSSLRPRLPDPGRFDGLADSAAETRGRRAAVAAGGAALAALALWLGREPWSPPAPRAPAAPEPAAPSAAAPRQPSPAEWLNFRGPGGNGVAAVTGVPTAWDGAAGSNVLWKTPVPLPGFSSPIVMAGRVFLTGGAKTAREVFAFNLVSGALDWRHDAADIGAAIAPTVETTSDTGYAAPTMAGDGERVFAMFATGCLLALDRDGKRLWSKSLGRPDNHYGHSSSLLVHEGRLFVQFDHGASARLIAFDPGTGKELWTAVRKEISWASPICVNTGRRTELILLANNGADSYDPATGKRWWEHRFLDVEVGTSAAYADGMVFAGNQYALMRGLRLGEAGRVETAWDYEEDLPEVASPLAVSNLVFVAAEGAVTCLDAVSGALKWKQPFDEGFWASPIAAEGCVYAMDRKGVMHIFEPAPEYREIGTARLGEESHCTPALIEGRILIRGKEHLFCIGARPAPERAP